MTLARYQNLRHEQPEPGLHVVTIDRPRALNALDSATLAELACVVGALAADRTARALLLTGSGTKAFVAGADISEMQSLSPEQARAFSSQASRLFLDIEALPMPAIALVNGYALGGGCELALACDWIVAADNAVFGQPEVNLGIPPGFGGTQRLPRLIGTGRALDLILTARQVRADEALAMGLVNYVADNALTKAREVAEAMLKNAPIAVSLVKEAVRRGMDTTLEGGLEIEADLFGMTVATKDFREGVDAFLNKRPAEFQGE